MSESLPSSESPGRRNHRNAAPWIGGAILILLGVVFLLQNVTGLSFDNWWSLFMLIPAIGALAKAWQIHQANGRWTAAARSQLVGGLILLLAAATFLFNFNWANVWPVFLIIAGVGALITALDYD
jgi:peptidoglycan/LPS O-acetylase OafA/YrhL